MSLFYKSGVTGEVVALEVAESYLGFQNDLAGHTRSTTFSDSGVDINTTTGVTVKAPYTGTFEQTDKLRRLADADIEAKKPGMIIRNDWERQAYITGFSHSVLRHRAKSKVYIALLNGYWVRRKTATFIAGLNDGGLDFPFDFPFDFSFKSGKGAISNDTALEAAAKITFYGQCTNPYVVIGGNRYQVNYSASAGAKIVIDFTGEEPSVTHYDQYGNGYSIFQYAVRTGGIDGGSYVFKPIQPGRNNVTWSGTFTMDIEWHERDSEVTWNI